MNYVGVDLHQKTSWFYEVDSCGNKLDSRNVPNTEEDLKDYFGKIPKPFTLAVESTCNWYFFVDLAQQYAEEVFLANSYELKAFAKRHKKTDKIDARLIANVLHKGFLPAVTIADKQTRQIREIIRYRINIVRDRSRNVSRLKALLDKVGCHYSGDFTTYKGLRSIDTEGLPIIYVDIINRYREQIMDLSERIEGIEKGVVDVTHRDVDMCNLLTIPGIGAFSAALIKSEIIDISRFRSFNRLCAYAGLAPRVRASADKIYYGALNTNRRKNLQWILIENVYHFIKGLDRAKQKFERIKSKKGHNTAKVSLARDMLKVIYHVLRGERPFYPEVDVSKKRELQSRNVRIQSVAATALSGV